MTRPQSVAFSFGCLRGVADFSKLTLATLALLAGFMGRPAVASDHVMAIDVSGSMRWNEAGQTVRPGSNDPMRIDIVRPPLLRYLGLLPDDSRVFLAAFNDGIVSQDEFILSRAGDRERMLGWVRGLNPPRDSRTHLWSTLRKALQKAREYASQTPGQWVSVRVITDGENDHPGSDLTITRILDEFPEISRDGLKPDLVLLGSLKTEFLLPIRQEEDKGRVNLIQPLSMADPFPPVIKVEPDPVIVGGQATLFDASESGFRGYTWHIDGEVASREARFQHSFLKAGPVGVRVEAVRSDGSRDSATRTIMVQPRPVSAAFYGPRDIVAGKAATFVSRASGPDLRHVWYVGEGKVGESPDLEHAFAAPGEYRVRLQVTDSAGNTDEAAVTVTVAAAPPAPAVPIAELRVVGDRFQTSDPIQFMDNSQGLVEEHRWDFAGEGTSGEKNPVFVFEQPGEKKIALVVVGPGGTARAERSLTILPKFSAPEVALTLETQSGRAPLQVQFEATIAGAYDSIRWDFGDGATATEVAPRHEYTMPGTYRPSVTVRHEESGLETTATVEEPLTIKAPLPGWLWAAVALALSLIGVLLGWAGYSRANPPLTGRLEWEFDGRSGEATLSGRKFFLSGIGIPGWSPEATYSLKSAAGRVMASAAGRAEVELPLHEVVRIEGAVFTYKGFD